MPRADEPLGEPGWWTKTWVRYNSGAMISRGRLRGATRGNSWFMPLEACADWVERTAPNIVFHQRSDHSTPSRQHAVASGNGSITGGSARGNRAVRPSNQLHGKGSINHDAEGSRRVNDAWGPG